MFLNSDIRDFLSRLEVVASKRSKPPTENFCLNYTNDNIFIYFDATRATRYS